MDHSFRQVGMTVVAAGVTTFTTGFVLAFCGLQTLEKFSAFIMGTISFSAIMSLIVYPGISYVIGPEGK